MSVHTFWCHTEGCPNRGIARSADTTHGPARCSLCGEPLLLRFPEELPAISLDEFLRPPEKVVAALIEKFGDWLERQGPTTFDSIATRQKERRVVEVLIDGNEPPTTLHLTLSGRKDELKYFVKIENGANGFFLRDLFEAIRIAINESETHEQGN